MHVRVFILCRHGESELNRTGRVNGDPSVRVRLTDVGVAEAHGLGSQLASVPLDACVHTRFGRTRETALLAVGGRDVPVYEQPLLDDVDVGELEGATLGEYRAWKREHARSDAFPDGESLDGAARRYAEALRAVIALEGSCILVVCHEIPIRYALNAAAGSQDLDQPAHVIANCVPYLFDDAALLCAAERIDALIDSS